MRAVLSVISIVVALGAYLPYARDIVRGQVRPARSTRSMFALLLVLALLQQYALGSGWALAVTLGEMIGTVTILGMSLKKGVGGVSRIDLVCYLLLAIDIVFWLTANDPLTALHLTLLADTIAFTPTLIKTWRNPKSETATFYILGAIAPLLSILGESNYSYGVILFPVYLSLANLLEVSFILRKEKDPIS